MEGRSAEINTRYESAAADEMMWKCENVGLRPCVNIKDV